MGWTSNDQLHEGYLDVVLADGARSGSNTSAGPVVQVCDDAGVYTGVDEQRSDDEVVAWVLQCNCSTPTSFGPVTMWAGDRWERVATPALEDVEAGQIYVAVGDDASDVMYREDVETVARARWLSEHLSPLEALDTIRTARTDIAAATKRLNQGVAYARASGKSWAEIGSAAGISRQAAHDRWGG